MSAVLGWDIGGANLKVARVAGDPPRVVRVIEQPFALWREPQRLRRRLEALATEMGPAPRHAVTMTAELCDCFATKRVGVDHVLAALGATVGGAPLAVYGADGRFHTVAVARARPLLVAAANWRATAALVAEQTSDAILIDVGSTTADLVPIAGGRVVARGHTDTARLVSGEVVFTGALRTPVCAIVGTLPLRGRPCRVAAEWFAIAADAHVWLRNIRPSDYTCDTPDGRGRTRPEAAARLARMIGADAESLRERDITALARAVEAAQVAAIAAGLRQIRARLGRRGPCVVVLAGQGDFLARAAARAASVRPRPMALPRGAARAAPAAAVALLLARRDRA